ncbi:MAG: hypothetical protein ACOYMK_04830 [Hyphomonadaceae bacterium]
MTVSWRHMLAGAGLATAIATVGLTAAGQSCSTCGPVSPPPPPPPPSACCQTPRNLSVNVPGVNVATANVHVGATSLAVASANASSMATAGVYGQASTSGGAGVIFGGGGGYYSNPGVPTSTISNLTINGGYETKLVEEDVRGTEEICVDKIVEDRRTRPVQAVCIDDRNTPHPASRVDGEMAVDTRQSGEIYRCMAGTHMQVTLGELVEGKASFEKADTFSCAKGEALWHGAGGAIQCRRQTPERDCNERSLLRKYGPGVKLVQVTTSKTICEPTTRQTITKVVKEVKVARPVAAGNLVLDGGVGQGY